MSETDNNGKMRRKNEIYSIATGTVFLISGMAKALDTAAFSETIIAYGLPKLYFMAPFIVLSEVLLGLLLIFHIRLKKTAAAATTAIIIFTGIYLYGAIFHGIKDCGCFGSIRILDRNPAIILCRNAILLYLSASICINGTDKTGFNTQTCIITASVLCIAAFMSGYTYKHMKMPWKGNSPQTEYDKLHNFVQTSADSTYLIFAFSYTCPHCLNSMANLKEYEPSGTVDKVIGLGIGNENEEKVFHSIFNPCFKIINCDKELLSLTKEFPKAYYVKDNVVAMELSGELPCFYIFRRMSEKLPEFPG